MMKYLVDNCCYIQANKGLFLGIFITSVTLVAVACYFVFDSGDSTTILLYFGTDLLLLSMLCVVVVAVFVKFQRLRFTLRTESLIVDQSLLIIAVFGVFVLECFHLVSALHSINAGGFISAMATAAAVLSFAQV